MALGKRELSEICCISACGRKEPRGIARPTQSTLAQKAIKAQKSAKPTKMLSSRKRYLQYLAAQRFYEEATGDSEFYQEDPSSFTEAELREEAAMRCWLREIDTHHCPSALPCSAALRGLADEYDWLYGQYAWWAWPVWSSCKRCSNAPVASCAECESYMRDCAMSE